MVNWIYEELIQLLTVNNDMLSEFITPENYPQPCWIDSVEESCSAFNEVITKLKIWYEFMARQILDLRLKHTLTWIRRSGFEIIILFQLTIISVNYALSIKTTTDAVIQFIDNKLEKLERDGQLCTEDCCICQRQNPICPFTKMIVE